MKRIVKRWPVWKLQNRFASIDFPEYQREPNVWSLGAKQRLIDSMTRGFDIAAFYLYETGEGSWDCVDGRQRIGAIMSFLGRNEGEGNHNGFKFAASNEIYDDSRPFKRFEGKTFADIKDEASADPDLQAFKKRLLDYEVTVVVLSDSDDEMEFNLQFTRLNLGAIINSGEKLRAMVGDLRDECFEEIGKHAFLDAVNIPTRRYSREQTAAQIIAQVFALEESREAGGKEFARTRHLDLQKLFKQHAELRQKERKWIDNVEKVMDDLRASFQKWELLRSRAMVVSTVVLAYDRRHRDGLDVRELTTFMECFLQRLKEQLAMGLDYDPEFRYLIEFQRNVTQASVEKKAVLARATVLEAEFEKWRSHGVLSGDRAKNSGDGGHP
jgi:hypothetical protein